MDRRLALVALVALVPACGGLDPGARARADVDLPTRLASLDASLDAIASSDVARALLGALGRDPASLPDFDARQALARAALRALVATWGFVDLNPSERARPAAQARLWRRADELERTVAAVAGRLRDGASWAAARARLRGAPQDVQALGASIDARARAFGVGAKRRRCLRRWLRSVCDELCGPGPTPRVGEFLTRARKGDVARRDGARTSAGLRLLGLEVRDAGGGLRQLVSDATPDDATPSPAGVGLVAALVVIAAG